MGDERHFLVIFGYETAALSSRGEDDLIKVLNATSPLDLSPTLAMFHLSLPSSPGPRCSHPCEHTWYRDVNIYYILNNLGNSL